MNTAQAFKVGIAALALFATPALADTAKTYSRESMALAIADFRSAWQQDAGNPYYGPDSSIEAQYAVQVAARAYEARKASAPPCVAVKPDVSRALALTGELTAELRKVGGL